MKNVFIVMSILMSTASFASKLNCQLEVNAEKIFSEIVEVSDGERISFFAKGEYKLFINQRGAEEFELEILNHDVPSRSYVKSNLVKMNDLIEYSLWNRDILFELKCELL